MVDSLWWIGLWAGISQSFTPVAVINAITFLIVFKRADKLDVLIHCIVFCLAWVFFVIGFGNQITDAPFTQRMLSIGYILLGIWLLVRGIAQLRGLNANPSHDEDVSVRPRWIQRVLVGAWGYASALGMTIWSIDPSMDVVATYVFIEKTRLPAIVVLGLFVISTLFFFGIAAVLWFKASHNVRVRRLVQAALMLCAGMSSLFVLKGIVSW